MSDMKFSGSWNATTCARLPRILATNVVSAERFGPPPRIAPPGWAKASPTAGRLLPRTPENSFYEYFIEGTSANRLSQKLAPRAI